MAANLRRFLPRVVGLVGAVAALVVVVQLLRERSDQVVREGGIGSTWNGDLLLLLWVVAALAALVSVALPSLPPRVRSALAIAAAVGGFLAIALVGGRITWTLDYYGKVTTGVVYPSLALVVRWSLVAVPLLAHAVLSSQGRELGFRLPSPRLASRERG